jgi:methyltransferase (TIGR00027 family)
MASVLPDDIVEATAKLLVASGAVSRGTVHFSRSQMAVGLYLAFDWIMPGQFEAFAYRKAFFERQVRSGIEVGARQVLMLGAGYDTLCWRLAPEFTEVTFFEIDHPATGRLKEKGIEAMGQQPNHHLIAEDLSQRHLEDVLQAYGHWDATAPTVIEAEGLLMYLPPEAVGTVFDQCAAVTGAGSRMVFTYVGTTAKGYPEAGPHSWLVLWLLKVGGEPWLWSIQPEALRSFLQQYHWTIAPELMQQSTKCGVEYFGVAVK